MEGVRSAWVEVDLTVEVVGGGELEIMQR